jgi:hypothetical protein
LWRFRNGLVVTAAATDDGLASRLGKTEKSNPLDRNGRGSPSTENQHHDVRRNEKLDEQHSRQNVQPDGRDKIARRSSIPFRVIG